MKRTVYIDGNGTICCYSKHSECWMIKTSGDWEVDYEGVIDLETLSREDNMETISGLEKFLSERVCYTTEELTQSIRETAIKELRTALMGVPAGVKMTAEELGVILFNACQDIGK